MKTSSCYCGGQLAIIFILVLPPLIAAIVLGTDAAVLYSNQAQLQENVDAAVLVGAAYLPSNPSRAVDTARTSANRNGVNSAEIVSTQVSSGKTMITMNVRRLAPYYFARLFGPASGLVVATATAIVRPSNSIIGRKIEADNNVQEGGGAQFVSAISAEGRQSLNIPLSGALTPALLH